MVDVINDSVDVSECYALLASSEEPHPFASVMESALGQHCGTFRVDRKSVV